MDIKILIFFVSSLKIMQMGLYNNPEARKKMELSGVLRGQ